MASRYSLPISPARPLGTNGKGNIMRVWFITGASRGFGALIAEAALAAGDAVVATARDPNTVAARLGAHERLLATRLDVTSEAEAHEAAGQAVRKFGRIDILVNNAGYGLLGAIEEASAAETSKLFGTNVFGLLGVTRAVLPHMRRQHPRARRQRQPRPARRSAQAGKRLYRTCKCKKPAAAAAAGQRHGGADRGEKRLCCRRTGRVADAGDFDGLY